ncbi:GNAT family N-acetyltransferase, partial [Oleiphilus sp. HI0117]
MIRYAGIRSQFSLISGRTQYVLKVGYDESVEKLSPGRFHMKVLIDRLIEEENIATLNLMSNARWHIGWNPNEVSLVSIFI